MGKPTICICENKDADQFRSNCEAEQRLCFRYSDSTIPLLLITEISNLSACFCECTARFVLDLVETQIAGFLMQMLIWCLSLHNDTPHAVGSHVDNATPPPPPVAVKRTTRTLSSEKVQKVAKSVLCFSFIQVLMFPSVYMCRDLFNI